MRIGFAANPLKEGALQTRDSLLRLTAERGIGHVLITDAAALLQEPHPVDILVVVGGDGSLLRYADAASSLKIPLLGVNLGRIGFLSELSEQAFPDALDRLLEGAYTIERRMMLRCTINEEAPLYCLNDIVVFKRTFSGVTGSSRCHTPVA